MTLKRASKLEFTASGLSEKDWRALKRLNTPAKIQDFLNTLPFNFEKRGQTHRSVSETLRSGSAHCLEGAFLAAACLWIQGERPLLLDLKVARPDLDHVVALFKKGDRWGAISKTNHPVLRYREPVYRSVRELAMSYFHEYFLQDGRKTMRSFSKPFDLRPYAPEWLVSPENLAWLAHELDTSPHSEIISKKESRSLRRAEEIEIRSFGVEEYPSGL